MKIFLLFCLLFGCLLAAPVFAETYTVTTTADSGAGSLRAAVASANTSFFYPDIIDFAILAGDPNCTADGVCTIKLTTGQQFIINNAGALTITNSTGASKLLISGINFTRLFYVNPGASLTLDGLTITKGNAAGNNGGGIYNTGTLSLTNSIVSDNTATSGGGGIYSTSGTSTTITNSTISSNKSASDNGGGIYSNSGTLTITNSDLSYNSAMFGGGIFSINSGTLTLTNSTVRGNSTSSAGGGIYNNTIASITNSTINGNTARTSGGGIDSNRGVLTIKNSTISGNRATLYGGGISSTSTAFIDLTSVTVAYNDAYATSGLGGGGMTVYNGATLRNTIVAKNFGFITPDFSGTLASEGYNLIGNTSGTTITGITTGNILNQDPSLDNNLVLNGGMTETHALLTGSPAIDKGNSFTLTTDQRGLTRPADNPSIANATGGNGADIGAFEVQLAPTAATVSINGRVASITGRGIRGVRLSLTDSSGAIRTATTTASGYYQFDDVQAGETYILSATAKHYTFSQPVQVLNINDEMTEVNFIANTEKRVRSF